jgi:UDP-glucose 4-epimerase
MKALVSGAGGFLGQHVVRRLLERNYKVRAIIRPNSPDPTWSSDVEVFRADLRVSNNLASAFDGVDAVLHLAAATRGDEDLQFSSTVVSTERFLKAMAESSAKRLIHVSSLVVYDWARIRKVMDEDAPLLDKPYGMGGYTIAKTWQERIVSRLAKMHGWDLTIMRPGFIWGPHNADIAGMGRRHGRVHVMFGPFTRLPLSHVVNCAHCLVAAVESPAAIGETFNVIDGDDVRVWRYALEYNRRTGRSAILVPIPYRAGLAVAQLASFASRTLFGKKGKLPSLLSPRRFESQFKPVRFSSLKAVQRLNWRPPLSFDKCLDLTFLP